MLSDKQEAVFRSAEMVLVEMFIPQEIARDAVYILGECGLLQVIDMNKKVRDFQRTFVSELRRLENVERQYRYFYSLLKRYNIDVYLVQDEEKTNNELSSLTSELELPLSTSVIDDHVVNAKILEERFVQMVEASDSLRGQQASLEEFRYLLLAGEEFFAQYNVEGNVVPVEAPVVDDDERLERGSLSGSSVPFFTGLIPRDKVATLERILWRVLRGNLYFKHVQLPNPIYDNKTKEMVEKDAFIVFTHGDLVIERSKKVAESLDATLYDVKESSLLRSQQLSELHSKLGDLHKVLETTEATLEAGLYSLSKELNSWCKQIYKEKMVYRTLNCFIYDSSRKTLTVEGWVPRDQVDILQLQLQRLTNTLGSEAPSIVNILETNKCPPTYHRTNKFTKAFQDICDCYGIPAYQEVNPGLATIVTFPFMFAIMFGDMGHGMLMSMAAAVLVLNEKSIGKMKRGEIFDMAFSGRYVLLLMGLFSIYTGLLYNDMFSKSLTLFKSGWKWPDTWEIGETISAEKVGVYPIGIDPAWHGTENSLLFSNSLKMKLSIIMGFIHMLYSYTFSLANALYFKDMVDIFCNFIPGLLFFCSIFGYLVCCIIYKWSVDWIKENKPAPGLLNTLINMFLSPGTIEAQLYPGQAQVQIFLLLLALLCVPWLLMSKPLYFKYSQGRHLHQPLPVSEYDMVDIDVEHLPANNLVEDDDEEEETGHGETLGDVVIHQVIHTIEWCLNCVSHTASYLRLWALSLAHAQLSTVLWDMTINIAFQYTGVMGVIATVCLFAMWFVLTCLILVVMEGTSAMLHSLRLHWVESMSKFFKGEGVAYEPFKFESHSIEDVAES